MGVQSLDGAQETSQLPVIVNQTAQGIAKVY
jgi:hypothetical protein